MQTLRAKVTEDGVVVPKEMLGAAEEVEIACESGHVVLVPVEAEKPLSIWDLGKDPVEDVVSDGSANHDYHIYDPRSREQGDG